LVTLPVLGRIFEHALFSGVSLALLTRRGVPLGDRGERRSTRLIFASSLRLLRERYEPVERALRALDVPVLVCWGDRDPFFTVAQGERTAAAARYGRLRLYTGCGHFVPVERPDALAADIASFATAAPTPA
jgi:pimeloyl-ACP methyl ester carboxylesterase